MYLKKRHQTWWAMHDIPRGLRSRFGGKARFAQTLETDDLQLAKARAAIYEARWRLDINTARKKGEPDEIESLANYWRKVFMSAPDHERPAILSIIRETAKEEIILPGAIARGIWSEDDPRFDAIPDHQLATDFITMATGEAARLEDNIDDYAKTLRNELKTVDMKTSTLRRFCTRFPLTRDVTKRAVQEWVNDELQTGKAVATVRRSLSELRGYWSFLQAMQVVRDDLQPFDKLKLPTKGKAKDGDEREPFTAEDVVKLRTAAQANGDTVLADLIDLARYTGCRIEELCALALDKIDTEGGSLEITDGKTAASSRVVPIHPELVSTVARLVGDRTKGYLLAELSGNKYSDRSSAIGKRFGRLKKELGFGPAHVFHSIRKTVSTLLENAGVPENVAADILGHEKPTMTYGLYSGGTSLAVRKEAIKKLAYPDG